MMSRKSSSGISVATNNNNNNANNIIGSGGSSKNNGHQRRMIPIIGNSGRARATDNHDDNDDNDNDENHQNDQHQNQSAYRQLEVWHDDDLKDGDTEPTLYGELMSAGCAGGWDPNEMFQFNEKIHHVTTTYDEQTLNRNYTIALASDDDPDADIVSSQSQRQQPSNNGSRNLSRLRKNRAARHRIAAKIAQEIEDDQLGRVTPESSDDDDLHAAAAAAASAGNSNGNTNHCNTSIGSLLFNNSGGGGGDTDGDRTLFSNPVLDLFQRYSSSFKKAAPFLSTPPSQSSMANARHIGSNQSTCASPPNDIKAKFSRRNVMLLQFHEMHRNSAAAGTANRA